MKPVADAVAIVETGDTRLYYTRLQPEERGVVAGIVRAITGSEELGVGSFVPAPFHRSPRR